MIVRIRLVLRRGRGWRGRCVCRFYGGLGAFFWGVGEGVWGGRWRDVSGGGKENHLFALH